eukprot:CAMPEP_0202077994 /NCGR_PEP_ID=MMETSP0964-20121228/5681_1 /ASSEMBLY_ACC=CAM_ASM_000500 /TAXON_ID=4773 /ORGANISM="Schizochytrium aggregatum, Strain ATCC28209" /LENGTH=45 /DNA_ID= /DNA_START= /DNA_END= /DNA_ORIENTATION=
MEHMIAREDAHAVLGNKRFQADRASEIGVVRLAASVGIEFSVAAA